MTDNGTAPKPGHYVPGGADDVTAEPDAAVPIRPPQPDPSPLSAGGHRQQQAYDWVTPPVARHASPAPPHVRLRITRPVLTSLVVAAIVATVVGVAAVPPLMKSYDALVERLLTLPTLDAVVVEQNEFYKTGTLLPSKCEEPSSRPSSQAGVTAYVQALLPCLNKSWEPTVRKAGHPFRAPKLVLFEGTNESAPCTGESSDSFYCGTDETIYISWSEQIENFKVDRTWARINLADTVAHEYGHHVQQLVGILDASQSIEDSAPNEAAQLLASRRVELQASCLSAAYLGADRSWFPVKGRVYDEWRWQVTNGGDDVTSDDPRDHGSDKSVKVWSLRGFDTPDPKSCNTFTASEAEVS